MSPGVALGAQRPPLPPAPPLFRQRLKYEIAEVMTEIDNLTSVEERSAAAGRLRVPLPVSPSALPTPPRAPPPPRSPSRPGLGAEEAAQMGPCCVARSWAFSEDILRRDRGQPRSRASAASPWAGGARVLPFPERSRREGPCTVPVLRANVR